MFTKDYDEMMGFFKKLNATDIWSEDKKEAFRVDELPNCPIMVSTMTDINSDADHIAQAMEESRLLLSMNSGQMNRIPMSGIAMQSLLGRIGLDCPAVSKIASTSKFDELATETKTELINTVLSHWKDGLKVLHRDGLIRYCGSDQYAVLPVSELLEHLDAALGESFPYSSFQECKHDDEYSTVVFDLNDDEIIDKIGSALGRRCRPILRFVTSDVGLCSASLYPFISIEDGIEMPLGAPLALVHKLPNTAAMIEDLVKGEDGSPVFAMFSKAAEKIESLNDIPVEFAHGCFINLAKQVMSSSILRKTTAMEIEKAMDDCVDVENCTALDVYNLLVNACTMEKKARAHLTLQDEMNITEALSRVLTLDIRNYDHKAEW